MPRSTPSRVSGLFDSGADYTTLRLDWKAALGVPDDQCVPTQVTGIGGIGNVTMTVVDAELDKHRFRMPVLFSATIPLDLFGRIGIVDQFTIELDPTKQLTTFSWKGQSQPWAKRVEADWKGKVTPGR